MCCTIEAMKLTTDRHEASRGLFATADLLVFDERLNFCDQITEMSESCYSYMYKLRS